MKCSKPTALLVSLRPADFSQVKNAALTLKEFDIDPMIFYIKSSCHEEGKIIYEIKNLFRNGVLKDYFMQEKNLLGVRNKSKNKKRNRDKSEIKNKSKRKNMGFFIKKHKESRRKARYFLLNFGLVRWYSKNFLARIKKTIYILAHYPFSVCNNILFFPAKKSFSYLKTTEMYLDNFKLYKRFFERTQVSIVILPEDVVGMICPLIIRAAHLYGIPSMILPYTICNQNEAFQSLKNEPNYQYNNFYNKVVGVLFKRWVLHRDGKSLIRLPSNHVLGHIFTRTSPPDPWMMNSGYANVIAIESKKMFDYYINSGIPETKLRIVGTFYDDPLVKLINNKVAERNKIYSILGIKNDKPLLLIGGCPDQTKGKVPGFDFTNISECVEFICNTLNKLSEKYNLVVRPHPNHMEIGDCFKRHEVIVTNLPTDKLIAVSDLYVAHASATIRWAIACAVPVINYDIFYYNFDDFLDVRGVVQVNSKEDFLSVIDNLSDPGYFLTLKKNIMQEGQLWMMLDGNSTQRIIALINELCSLKQVPRTTR